MEHGDIQVSGAGMSLEAVLSVLCSRAVSNQNVVPGNEESLIREACDNGLWKLGNMEEALRARPAACRTAEGTSECLTSGNAAVAIQVAILPRVR